MHNREFLCRKASIIPIVRNRTPSLTCPCQDRPLSNIRPRICDRLGGSVPPFLFTVDGYGGACQTCSLKGGMDPQLPGKFACPPSNLSGGPLARRCGPLHVLLVQKSSMRLVRDRQSRIGDGE